MQPQYRYKAFIARVVDGDTIDAELDLGFKIKIKERFRMAKINAPEIKGDSLEAGLVTMKWLQDRVENKFVFLDTTKGEDKYGRWICYIYDELCVDNKSINEEMIELGLAISYM